MKGIAICAMLFHHLYYSIPNWIKPYDGVLCWLGELGKVCVALFLFCSGYGLSVHYAKINDVKGTAGFLVKRFASFYLNYWMVFLIFVPITVFVFHRPLAAAYGEHANLIKHLLYDLLGVQGFQSYNITWWFNKLIIVLWLLFPIIYWLAKKNLVLTLLGSLLIARYWKIVVGYDYYCELYMYQLPFVLGMIWQMGEIRLQRMENIVVEKPKLFSVASICILVVFIYLRMKPTIPFWSGPRMDAFLSCSIALLVVSLIRNVRFFSTTLSFLGKHSGNIYLIHTFYNVYWHPEWLHTSTFMRSGANFVVLLGLSLVTSIILEIAKERMGIYALSRRMLEKI